VKRVFVVVFLAALFSFSCERNSLKENSSTDSLLSYLGFSGLFGVSNVNINQVAGQADPTNILPITFTIVFNEAINPATFDATDISQNGTASGITWALSTADDITWTLQATAISTSGMVVPAIAAGATQFLSGNYNTASSSIDNSVDYDTIPLDVAINQAVGQADPTNATPIAFRVVFSEAINPATFTTTDIAQGGTAGGITWALSTLDNIIWTLEATSITTPGTVVPGIAAGMVQDLSGNNNFGSTSTDNSVEFDINLPDVTVNQAGGQSDPTNTTPIEFTVVFSEEINPATFSSADITQSGTATVATWALSTSDNITWTLEATGITTGTVVPNIAAGVVQDLSGNYNTASASTDNSVDYDSIGPSVAINQAGGQSDPTNATPIAFAVVFSEAINPATFSSADINQSGTASGITWALSTSDNITWTLRATAVTTPGTLVPSIAAGAVQDLYGNDNAASASTDNSVMYDTVAPVIATFTVPGTTDWKTVAVSITANDNVLVTGWMITETSAQPAAGDPGWLTASPTCYTLSGMYGAYELYAWVKDGAGNVSVSGPSTHFPITYSAPSFPARIMQTGQTLCYDAAGTAISCAGTGQDGELRRGLLWPVPRFTNNGPTITDNLTGLVWTTNANLMASTYSSLDTDGTAGDGLVYWQTALNFAAQLRADNYCGYTDWRLPNIVELMSILNFGSGLIRTWFSSFGISYPVGTISYWSSTSYNTTPGNAWTLRHYSSAKNFGGKNSNLFYAWAVAGTSTILPQTGQTLCYNTVGTPIACAGTGQDGDYQYGVAWVPATRFTINGDGTITDNLTGLMWIEDVNSMTTLYPSFDTDGTTNDGWVTWQHALDYVAMLNTDVYLGYNDWKLPNVYELLSLQNHGYSINWLYDSGFNSIYPEVPQAEWFWSSTTYEITGFGEYAKIVNDVYGNINSQLKTNTTDYYIWPVRGGN